jgi:8-oxo-dGTP diphosphatase
MKEYVVGFAFNPDKTLVALIRKQRPSWQKGRLNGIGGHVEANESPWAAMAREFVEETHVVITRDRWQHYATLVSHQGGDDQSVGAVVHFYKTTMPEYLFNILEVAQPTDERVEVVLVANVVDPDNPLKVMHNLPWLILAAKQNVELPRVIETTDVRTAQVAV